MVGFQPPPLPGGWINKQIHSNVSWICSLCHFPSREGSSGSGTQHQGLKGSWGVAVGWHWGTSWGHLYPLQVTKHSWPAWMCAQPLQVLFPCPGATCQAPCSGSHWLSAPLPEIHLQLFYSLMPNPQRETGISCLYMELQTCIKASKDVFIKKSRWLPTSLNPKLSLHI